MKAESVDKKAEQRDKAAGKVQSYESVAICCPPGASCTVSHTFYCVERRDTVGHSHQENLLWPLQNLKAKTA